MFYRKMITCTCASFIGRFSCSFFLGKKLNKINYFSLPILVPVAKKEQVEIQLYSS